MKLQKLNVIYTVEDPQEIQYLKSIGFKEVKEKDVKKEDKILPPKDKEVKEKDDAKK